MVAIARSFGAARVAARGFTNAARQPTPNTLYAVLGFAFAEATGLFALMMSFLLLYVA
ncbi:ATP synthase subunit 9 [Pyrenophora seminiperda CCB06]|uniref:ATP synthase subunit 9 (Mitochondrion) n=1 Tax=Pyrenophora seminiperda CCB06 TaxID=1302712 RepID=A0A3M7M6L3_9PLEO|nr:ATP synthase subunit 9 [Pyrenophora seminiperda CCB06]